MKKQRINYLKNPITLLCILLCAVNGSGQITRLVVKPIDVSEKKSIGLAMGNNDILHHAYITLDDNKPTLVLERWNNRFWQQTARIKVGQNPIFNGIKVSADGKIYIYGSFNYILNSVSYKNLLVLEKGNWVPIKALSEMMAGTKINTVSFDKDTVMIGGKFDSLGVSSSKNLAFLVDNVVYTAYQNSSNFEANNEVLHCAFKDKKWYVSGMFDTIGGVAVNGFGFWNKRTWENLSLPFNSAGIFEFWKDKIIIQNQATNTLFSYDSGTKTTQNFQLGINTIDTLQQLMAYNGKIMAVGKFQLSTSGNIRTGWIENEGLFWKMINAAGPSNFLAAGTKDLFILGTNLLGFLSPAKTPYIAQHNPDDRLIFGTLSLDLNNNCLLDSGDFPVAKTSILFGTDKNAVYTNDRGVFYYFYQNTAAKMPKILFENDFMNYGVCIADSALIQNPSNDIIGPVAINLTLTGAQRAKLNTRLILHGGRKIQLNGRNMVTYVIRNIGLVDAKNIKITLNGTQKLKNIISEPKFQVNDTSIFWNISNISPLGFAFIHFSYGVQDNFDVIDKELDFNLDYEYNDEQGDLFGENFFSQVITGDNQATVKEQSLPNKPQEESANIAATDTIIEYQINFQNRTNELVTDVVVIDTLDLRYNLLYTQTIASSHDFTTTVKQDATDPNIGYLIYTFANLSLTSNASGDGEITSDQGYIKFKFVFDRHHQLNDEIKNTAMVIMNNRHYFPANAVICNVDKLVSAGSISPTKTINIYPNPTSGQLYITEANFGYSYQIIDHKGAIISKGNGITSDGIQVSHLASGMYFIQLSKGSDVFLSRFIKN